MGKCLGISNYSSRGGGGEGGTEEFGGGHMVSTANKEGGIVRILQNLTREHNQILPNSLPSHPSRFNINVAITNDERVF